MADETKISEVEAVAPIAHTRDFIDFMGTVMRGVISGAVSPEKAKAVIAGGNVILRAMELNVEWSRLRNETPGEAMPLMLEIKPEKPVSPSAD